MSPLIQVLVETSLVEVASGSLSAIGMPERIEDLPTDVPTWTDAAQVQVILNICTTDNPFPGADLEGTTGESYMDEWPERVKLYALAHPKLAPCLKVVWWALPARW